MAVAIIDAPGHGDRQPDGGHDRDAAERAWRAHWRAHAASQIANEYSALIDLLAADAQIDARRIGYWGLSLATQYGIGVLAKEPRIRAAVLGLSALPSPGPRLKAYAEQVHCPVFFIQQLDDEIAAPERSRALFQALSSTEKTLRASHGSHTAVPAQVFEEAISFLTSHLGTSH
jgi:pimeloyl-ACP methyl ester carboxylesterase